MICTLTEPNKAAPVFARMNEPDTLVIACLEGVMGTMLADDPERPRSAMAVVGCFAFPAGEPSTELMNARPDRWLLVVPENEAWAALLEDNYPAEKRMRYALKKDTRFDRARLEALAAVPEGYVIRRIDGEIYDLCLADGLFEDCVSVFGSKEKYLALGRGYAVLKDGRLVSAASSYSRYRGGIDIEIDTVKPERRRGLGTAAAARLILACLDEGLYPAWDAANKASVRLAEKLGYEFSREYVCYGIE